MPGETDLNKLLKHMSPRLHEGEYVFCTVDKGFPLDFKHVQAMFMEDEAMSIVLHKAYADRLGLAYAGLMAWISLDVHSSLQAVGLTASISKALTTAGISCNIIAAYYHDHLFIPKEQADAALRILAELSEKGLP